VKSERLGDPDDRHAGGVQASPEIDVLVPPRPVERLAPASDLERLEAAVADVAPVKAVVGVRVPRDRPGVKRSPVGAVAGAVGRRRAHIGQTRQPSVGVRPDVKALWQPDESAQPEGRRGAAAVRARVRRDEPRWGDHVVVQGHDDLALGGAQAAVASPCGREAGPVEREPLDAEGPCHGPDTAVGGLCRRTAHDDHLEALARENLGRQAPQRRGQVAAPTPEWDHHGDGRLGLGRRRFAVAIPRLQS
jgi:hypothetical protein